MIQRIQTVFLFFSFGFLAAMLMFDIADIALANELIVKFSAFGVTSGGAESSGNDLLVSLPAAILIIIAALLSLLSIFLYKKRMLQKRLGVYNIIILFGLMGLLYYLPNYMIDQEIQKVSYLLPATFPLIAVILTVLANRAITKDEKLVRAADRIR